MELRERFEKEICPKCSNAKSKFCKINRDIPCVPYKEWLEFQLKRANEKIEGLEEHIAENHFAPYISEY